MKNIYDITIIGGGAAGLSAALEAYDPSLKTLIIEREQIFGGILNQCIHNGFGLHVFKEELTGPEYAQKLIDQVIDKKIDYILDTTVVDIKKDKDFIITVTNVVHGEYEIKSKAVILTSGCYERSRGQISIPGDRPKGVMTAGSAQRYLNMDGYLVGKDVFILGSGDIGLIMARRMTLEGANVLGVAELMPFSNGLTRNVVQCLNDFDIPLYLSHTVIDVIGKESLEEIVIQEVDKDFNFIDGTQKHFKVDTLLLSVGLIPDVKLFDSLSIDIDFLTKSAYVNQALETSVNGLFVCGNALHVHDLVDDVTIESQKAGRSAKNYILNANHKDSLKKRINYDSLIRYIVPQSIDFNQLDQDVDLAFRTTKKIAKAVYVVEQNNKIIKEVKAKFIVPAEMQKIKLKISDFISKDEIFITVKEVD
ncbi:MAG: FAD-dependent oxidoreductase [Acholeplasmataceae bacterium]|nr:FAD-dependent oxidoreductase [Acholeplasmataceae bacterium]